MIVSVIIGTVAVFVFNHIASGCEPLDEVHTDPEYTKYSFLSLNQFVVGAILCSIATAVYFFRKEK